MTFGYEGMKYGIEIGVFTEDCRKSGDDLLLKLTEEFEQILSKHQKKYKKPLNIAGKALLSYVDEEQYDEDKMASTMYLVRKTFVDEQTDLKHFTGQVKA